MIRLIRKSTKVPVLQIVAISAPTPKLPFSSNVGVIVRKSISTTPSNTTVTVSIIVVILKHIKESLCVLMMAVSIDSECDSLEFKLEIQLSIDLPVS